MTLKINALCQWTQLISQVLESAVNNKNLDMIEKYVKEWNKIYPRGIFDYKTNRYGSTLEIYLDDELALSLTIFNELVSNENY